MDHEQIDDMLAGLGTYAITKQKDSTGRRVGKRVLVWRDLRELSGAMLATRVRIGEVLAVSGDDVIKDDDGKTAVRIDAHIVRVTGVGIVRVPGRKGNKPGVVLRLDGPRLTGELPSEGMTTGALRVPPSGQPILLLTKHPTTGATL